MENPSPPMIDDLWLKKKRGGGKREGRDGR
jgi:hypothetical protein